MKDNYFVVVGKVVFKCFDGSLGHVIALKTKDGKKAFFYDVAFRFATNAKVGMTAEVWGHFDSNVGTTYLIVDSLKEFKGDDY